MPWVTAAGVECKPAKSWQYILYHYGEVLFLDCWSDIGEVHIKSPVGHAYSPEHDQWWNCSTCAFLHVQFVPPFIKLVSCSLCHPLLTWCQSNHLLLSWCHSPLPFIELASMNCLLTKFLTISTTAFDYWRLDVLFRCCSLEFWWFQNLNWHQVITFTANQWLINCELQLPHYKWKKM